MRQPYIKIIISVALLAIAAWCFLPDTDADIMRKLKSDEPTSIIEGAQEAANEQNVIFISQLLKDSWHPWASTSLHYKGFTVYTECMYSLKHILHVKPPHSYYGILKDADPVNIKFYTVYWHLRNLDGEVDTKDRLNKAIDKLHIRHK